MSPPTSSRVLLVDDEPDLLTALAAVIRETLGVEVVTATTGPQALATAAKLRFSLVICDYQMPGMDGFQVAAEVHERGGPPVLLVSALASSTLREKAITAPGVVGWLRKDSDPMVLLENIRRHLANTR